MNGRLWAPNHLGLCAAAREDVVVRHCGAEAAVEVLAVTMATTQLLEGLAPTRLRIAVAPSMFLHLLPMHLMLMVLRRLDSTSRRRY